MTPYSLALVLNEFLVEYRTELEQFLQGAIPTNPHAREMALFCALRDLFPDELSIARIQVEPALEDEDGSVVISHLLREGGRWLDRNGAVDFPAHLAKMKGHSLAEGVGEVSVDIQTITPRPTLPSVLTYLQRNLLPFYAQMRSKVLHGTTPSSTGSSAPTRF